MTISIEDERALTAWITLKLESLTKYDPKRLSAYLVAIIKKKGIDKDYESLKSLCKRKLNVFFEDKVKLDDICEEIINATENHKYEEIRSHPIYVTFTDDARPLISSSNELPQSENKPYRSGSPEDRRAEVSRRPPTDDEDFGEDSAQVKPTTKSKVRSVSPVRTTSAETNVLDDKRNKRPPTAASRMTCKDFTERGFCMRGQYCPFDHGSDPVVWQNARPLEVIRYNAPHLPALPPQPVRMPAFPPMPLPMIRPVLPPRFRPDNAAIHPPYIRAQKPANMRPRELVGLSTVGAQPSSFNFNEVFRGSDITKREADNMIDSPLKRLALSEPTDNCTLEIRNVPDQLNNISALNAHFSKYGSIVNVQVRYGNDQKSALVTFQTPEAAARAFRSPEPVLNNRFIAISWHMDSSKDKPKSVNKVGPVTSVKAIAPAPVKTEPETNRADSNAAPPADEATESAVTSGFTQGVRVRYPVGGRRARAGRFRGASARGRAVPESVGQAQSIATHQKLIYSTLEVSKTEAEIEKVQAQTNTLDDLIGKLNTSVSSYHRISEQYRSRMENDPSTKKEEITPLLEKIEKQITQWQLELKKHEDEKILLVRKRSVLEQKLNLQQSQNEMLKAKLEGETSGRGAGDGVNKPDYLKDTDPSRGYAARGAHNRPSPYRTPRSPRRTAGASRFRRAGRAGPFNRVIDRRPKRVKLTGILENERAGILRHIQACGAKVVASSEEPLSLTLDFNIRYEGDACLRDLPSVINGRKLTATWISGDTEKSSEEVEQSEIVPLNETTANQLSEAPGDDHDLDLVVLADLDEEPVEGDSSNLEEIMEDLTDQDKADEEKEAL